MVVMMGFPGVGGQRGGGRTLPDQATTSVYLDVVHPFIAPQRIVVFPLEPGLPDNGSEDGPRVLVGAQIGFGHLGDVAGQVPDRFACGV